mgnify:CR=1 FL=1
MKQSHFGDVVEKVVAILSRNPWSDFVIEDLNKSNVYLNSYHVVSILKALVNPKTALGFFAWAKKQTGFRHNGFTYTKLFEILGEAKDFKTIDLLMEDIVKDQYRMLSQLLPEPMLMLEWLKLLSQPLKGWRNMTVFPIPIHLT